MTAATLGHVHDLADLPPIIKIAEMARVLRLAIGTIRRDCQRGTFQPKPISHRPYRWLKADLIAYLDALSAPAAAAPAYAPASVQPTRRRSRS